MIVYLALGSNEGDRVGYIQQAIQALSFDKQIKIISTSSFYETEPLGGDISQRWFVNAIIALETRRTAQQLMQRCLKIETTLGRVREPQNRYASRTIDLDILFYGNEIIDEPGLIIPHPRLHERACVLVPMLEVNARMVHPILKRSMDELHHRLESPEMVFLYGTLPRDDDTLYTDADFLDASDSELGQIELNELDNESEPPVIE